MFYMIALTDAQLQETNGIAAEAQRRVPPLPIATSELKTVMATTAQLPQAKRDIFLQRVAEALDVNQATITPHSVVTKRKIDSPDHDCD
jgi:hypothetical protein